MKASEPKSEVRGFLTKRDIMAGDMKSYYVWQQVIEAMQEFAEVYHKEKLREELIKFTQPFYADEETCRHNVDEYLKQKQ